MTQTELEVISFVRAGEWFGLTTLAYEKWSDKEIAAQAARVAREAEAAQAAGDSESSYPSIEPILPRDALLVANFIRAGAEGAVQAK